MNEYPRVLSATTMIGDKVVNSAGEVLGDLKELMIDLDDGHVSYAVLSFGGFLGMGDKLFAIPWEALTLNTEDHTFILNVEKEQLENAPGFDKDNWPDEADYQSGWLLDLYNYYGYRPYWMSEAERDSDQYRSDRSRSDM
jgi:sporulation protein YlmC with PRC-barrel domain